MSLDRSSWYGMKCMAVTMCGVNIRGAYVIPDAQLGAYVAVYYMQW